MQERFNKICPSVKLIFNIWTLSPITRQNPFALGMTQV